ncbi:hypothetical protein BKE38_05075 [Pseudoroseomonas deserti]|uniref:Uncharacterized protein n=1 Tax=Teichococcus deserti TaxID=1817963 RepID=A0A1V2H5W0_9PROT|nr:hypothetical protein [Pseudoroseomonas deserti]ONG56968.1 hypothetical protein BKE38_05075 [Pseudoroseomonas deserti]
MTVVTKTGVRTTKSFEGRRYTVRAPSFDEAGNLATASGYAMRPTAAVINWEIREALGRAGKPEMAAAIDEYEAAEIAFQDARLQLPIGETDPEALREPNKLVSDARQRLMKADVARKVAEWAVRDDKALQEMRALALKLDRSEHAELVALCVVGWEGEGLPSFEPPAEGEKLEGSYISKSLPAGDVAALAQVALGMINPTKEDAGN